MTKRHKKLQLPEGTSPEQDFVQILDPATGTGTFLVEVIDLIHKTLTAKWKAAGKSKSATEALWNEYVPTHLLTRLHAYELKMAPYTIAHLKIGLKLLETGYQFGGTERARVYLTNALEPAQDFSGRFDFAIPALAHEAQAVNEIKSNRRFTVVIGNPPYSSLSQNMGEWIKSLVIPFRTMNGVAIEEKGKRNHLQDDYVKFFRLALLQLEQSRTGVIGLITNHGYLYSPTFRAMRRYILEHVSGARVLDLNGNAKRDDAKRFPGDENVFDIQQGVAISTLWLSQSRPEEAGVEYGTLFGSRAEKTAALSLTTAHPIVFQKIRPTPDYFLFESSDISRPPEYEHWLKLDDAMPFGGTGVKTNRDDFVIDFEDEPILRRMDIFRDQALSDSEVQQRLSLRENYTWKIPKQRRLFREDQDRDRLRDIDYRPFDTRRIYYQRHVVYNPRLETMRQANGDNVFLLLPSSASPSGGRSSPDSRCAGHLRAVRLAPGHRRGRLYGRSSSCPSPDRVPPDAGAGHAVFFSSWRAGRSQGRDWHPSARLLGGSGLLRTLDPVNLMRRTGGEIAEGRGGTGRAGPCRIRGWRGYRGAAACICVW
jgi:predicted helicase